LFSADIGALAPYQLNSKASGWSGWRRMWRAIARKNGSSTCHGSFQRNKPDARTQAATTAQSERDGVRAAALRGSS
jgi:hypothetical protein